MTKNQLIRLLYYKNNTFTQKIISQIVDLILNEIAKGIVDCKTVEVRDFGRFVNKSRKAKTLRHPTTGKLIKVAPYKTMRYTCSTKIFENV